MQEFSKILSLFLVLLFCACGNKNKTAENQRLSDSIATNSMVEEFFIKNEFPQNQWEMSNDSLIAQKIQKDGLILNIFQKNNLLDNIVKYPTYDYTAIFYTADILVQNIISAMFFVQYSDLEEILLVNYSLDCQLIDYLKIWQIENSDLLFQDSINEVSYSCQNQFFIEKEHIQLITKYEELTHNLSSDEKHISYKDSVCKYCTILESGKFHFIRTDSLIEGVKFANW
jgi:hypothetical protein